MKDPIATKPWLRLRQICLVAADLDRQTRLIESVLGLQVCHRDPNVARYGLANVLFPVGSSFLEIVSPTQPGTAAGRFIERHGGRHGYMVILDCDDPEVRGRHAESLGVRIANRVEHDDYLGVQLHPRDTGGAMIEFNRTVGGESLDGPYAPAGPAWRDFLSARGASRLVAVEIGGPFHAALAARWGAILERPVDTDGVRHWIALDAGEIEFVGEDLADSALTTIVLEVTDRGSMLAAAQAAGCVVEDDTVDLCGVKFRLRDAV